MKAEQQIKELEQRVAALEEQFQAQPDIKQLAKLVIKEINKAQQGRSHTLINL